MDGAYWSIVYEITFYGWIFVLMSVGWFQRKLDWIIVIGSPSRCSIWVSGITGAPSPVLTDESGFFAAGVLLHAMYRGRRDRTVVLLLTLAAVTAVRSGALQRGLAPRALWCRPQQVVLAGVAIAVIGMVALAMNIRSLPIPAPIILAIGGITYPLYLLHQHIGYMVFNRLDALTSPALLIPGMTLAMFGASWLVWRYIERPAQK